MLKKSSLFDRFAAMFASPTSPRAEWSDQSRENGDLEGNLDDPFAEFEFDSDGQVVPVKIAMPKARHPIPSSQSDGDERANALFADAIPKNFLSVFFVKSKL